MMVMAIKERKTNEVMWEKGMGNSKWQCCGSAREAATLQFITGDRCRSTIVKSTGRGHSKLKYNLNMEFRREKEK